MDTINSLPLVGAATDFTSTAKNPSRLHEASQQFEALMVGEMLKSARESSEDGWLGSGSGGADDSAMDMAEAQFANALARGGAFGLANIVEHNVQQPASAESGESMSRHVSSV